MLDRTIVLPIADWRLVKRQREQWHRRRPLVQRKYEYPCWECGEIGVMGVDGFGAKGLIRPRNMLHRECYDALDEHTKMIYRIRDAKHVLRRYQRHKSKKNLDRVAIRERTIYADYYQRTSNDHR